MDSKAGAGALPAKTNGSTKVAAADPPRVLVKWGVSAAEFLFSLRDKPVQLIGLDGRAVSGVLVGADTYDLIVRKDSGNVVMCAKHALRMVQAGAPGATGTSGA